MRAVEDPLWRARVVEELFTAALDATPPELYVEGVVFDPTPGASLRIAEQYHGLGPQKRMAFGEVVCREPDPMKWVSWIEHEQEKAGSDWKRGDLQHLPGRLRAWWADLTRDPAVQRIDHVLTDRELRALDPAERERFAIEGFRVTVRRLART